MTVVQQGAKDTSSQTWDVQDDFTDGEILTDKIGDNTVHTFTFTSSVHLLVLESDGVTHISRADPFGGTPSSSVGIPLRHQVPTYVPVVTSGVKVYIPQGASVSCYGLRR